MKRKSLLIIMLISLAIFITGFTVVYLVYVKPENGIDRITIDPIMIDNSLTGVDAHNWTWAVNQPWCNGSGTWDDPYIIKNVKIDANNNGSCIFINNSQVYFRIENCCLINAGGCYEPGCYKAGIHLESVGNGTINNNDCFNNSIGISLIKCYYNNITNNRCISNLANGILLTNYGKNNIIAGNTLRKNFNGIVVSSGPNIILENIIEENRNNGIVVAYCGSNIISENSIIRNNNDGIELTDSNSNTVRGNILKENAKYGITQLYSQYNLFYENHFIGNKRHVSDPDPTATNKWNTTNIGNYWDNYTGIDTNSDGIGDTPYSISTSPLIQDHLPIMESEYDTNGIDIVIVLIIIGIIAVVVVGFIILIKRSKKEKGRWITKDGRRIFIKEKK